MLSILLVLFTSVSTRRPDVAITIDILAVCCCSWARSCPTAGGASTVGDAARLAHAFVPTATVAATGIAGAGVTISNTATGGSVRLRQLLDDPRQD